VPVILAPGRWRQEDPELEVSLGYIVKLCLKKNKTKKPNQTKNKGSGGDSFYPIQYLPSSNQAFLITKV
jgi:hypothetical protein